MRQWMRACSIVALAALFWNGTALGADDKPDNAPERATVQEHRGAQDEMKAGDQTYHPELRRITELQGMKVITEGGKNFGTVEDMIIDADHGRVVYAVISHGGLLGIGDKDVLVPFGVIHGKRTSTRLLTSATIEQLKQAEGFDDENLAQVRKLSDADYARRFNKEFKVKPYWEESRGTGDVQRENEKEEHNRLKNRSESESAMDETERGSKESARQGPGEMVLASTLLDLGGVDILTKEQVDAGDLEDLMVDLNHGFIGYAIVNRESEIAPDNALCAVPWEVIKLRRSQPRPNLVVDLPLHTLKDAPGFPAGHWPDMAQMEWNEDTTAYYDAEPYYVIYGYVQPDETMSGYADRDFARGELKTCTGTIESIRHGRAAMSGQEGARQVTTLRIKLTKGQQLSQDQQRGDTVSVILAPSDFLKSKDLNLQEGQEVTVKGWKARRTETTKRIIAMNLEVGGKSVELRQRDGKPQWKKSESQQ